MVYILHFETPHYHAQHYVGYSRNKKTLNRRMNYHRSGNGARLIQVITDKGIDFVIGTLFEDKERDFEKWIKRQKNTKRFCKICRGVKQ